MIKFVDVSKSYSGHYVLKDVNVEIGDKEFVSIVGPSGAGKSTIVRLIIKEELPSSGKIFIGGKDISNISFRQAPLLRRKIGVVFQDFKLLPQKTVYENVAFAMEVSGKSNREIRNTVPEILKLVNLEDKNPRFPHELSGGEQQRVTIARALVHKPKVLIADEPTGNLDPQTSWDIINLLVKINKLGTTVILATHDKEIVNKLKKRVITLRSGMVIKDKKVGKYSI